MANTYTFEDYCEDHLDQDPALMSTQERIDAERFFRAELEKQNAQQEKTPSEIARHQKTLEEAKAARKLAKFYGGTALTGSAKQKKWAEEIRQNVLESAALTEEQKTGLMALGGQMKTAKFWINNRDRNPHLFDADTIAADHDATVDLYETHHDALLGRRGNAAKLHGRRELYMKLVSNTFEFHFNFTGCEFYDVFGKLDRNLEI